MVMTAAEATMMTTVTVISPHFSLNYRVTSR